MAKIEPRTGVIDSMRNQGLPWNVILGELIDNAFDASATRVSFNFDAKRLEVSDDGSGCLDVLAMLRIGDRNQHCGTQLGRYGIGAKDAAISAADGITIVSTHKGITRRVGCNWRVLEKANSWEIEDPTALPADGPSGTRIVLSPLRTDRIRDPEALIKKLSLQYTPAIRDGKQIVLQFSPKKPPVAVPEFRYPPLDHLVTADLNVNGKEARVTLGIIPQNHVVELGGVVISYGYRVICTGSRIGLGSHPTPNLFGWVELGKGWELTKNKDNISSNLEPLGQAIAAACRDTIEVASKQATSVVFDGVAKAVNDALHQLEADCGTRGKTQKAKRGPKVNVNRLSVPTGRGTPHSGAARTQPGSTFGSGRTTSAIKVAFRSMGASGPSSAYEHQIVYLNKDIPVLASHMDDPDWLAVHAVYSAATYIATDDGRQKKLFEGRDPGNITDRIYMLSGMLLSKMPNEVERKRAIA